MLNLKYYNYYYFFFFFCSELSASIRPCLSLKSPFFLISSTSSRPAYLWASCPPSASPAYCLTNMTFYTSRLPKSIISHSVPQHPRLCHPQFLFEGYLQRPRISWLWFHFRLCPFFILSKIIIKYSVFLLL